MNLNPIAVRSEIERMKVVAPEAWDEGEEQLLHDMLEGSSSLLEFLTVVIDQAKDAEAMAGAIAGRIAELEIRQARCERKNKSMRALALSLMQAAGLNKAVLSIATLSVGKPRQSLKIDEAAVPDEYLKYSPAPDRDKIKAALESGTQFNWARMLTGEPSLTVRSK